MKQGKNLTLNRRGIMMKPTQSQNIEMKTDLMKVMFKDDPDVFMVALSNMFAFGDTFDEMDSPVTDEQLQQIYDALSQIENVIKS